MADVSKLEIASGVYNIKDANARARITNLETITHKRYVFIGDSYGEGYSPDGNVTSWIDLVIQYGLITDYIKLHRGGSGFCNGFTFLEQLQNATIEHKETVTDIVVCGGYNDGSYTEGAINDAINYFNTYCIDNFPNARLWIGMIGYNIYRADISKNIVQTVYKAYSGRGIRYLSGVENVLRSPLMFSSDGFHPNQNGQTYLGKAIYQALMTGYGNVAYKGGVITKNNASNVSSYSGNCESKQFYNGMVDVNFSRGNVVFAEPFNYTCTGQTFIEIAHYVDLPFIGNYDRSLLHGYVHDSNGYHNVAMNYTIADKVLYVTITAINALGNNYLQLTNVDQIYITDFNITSSVML